MTDNTVLLAKIGAPHGIKGEVRVVPYGEPDMLDQYGKLQAADGRKFKIKRMRAQKNLLVVKFEGVNSRNEAEALNGIELYIDRDKLPAIEEEDEFYVQDLIGCDVLNEAGEMIGSVLAVPNFGAGDMLEIARLMEGGGISPETYFVPFTQACVPEIDLEAHAVTVIPPVEVSERDKD